MDQANEILVYLEALSEELIRQSTQQQCHILVTGGAYMLLQGQRRATDDIDFATVVPERKPKAGRVFRTTVHLIFTHRSRLKWDWCHWQDLGCCTTF